MIFTHCLLIYLALWLSGLSAFLGNRRSLVHIRAVSHYQIILWFIVIFTMFVFQNDFHPLSSFLRAPVA